MELVDFTRKMIVPPVVVDPAQTKQIIYVLCAAYSGSTLLNHMLDVQPGCRGLSECEEWFLPNTAAHCPRCKGSVQKCANWQRFAGRPDFWQQQFDYYPSSHTFVECSKHPDRIIRLPLPPAGTMCRAVILMKLPHEFVWSAMRHDKVDVKLCFRRWFFVYEHILKFLAKATSGQTTENVPIIANRDVLRFAYRDLATKPAQVIHAICSRWNIEFNMERALAPWDYPSDTCMIGGNNAVYAQRVSNQQFFSESNAGYLDGKYVGQAHRIFLDDQWRKSNEFIKACRVCYQDTAVRLRIDTVSKALGYRRGVEGLEEDLG